MQEPPVQSNPAVTLLRSSHWLHVFSLLVLCGLLYFPYLGATPFFDKGEPREALAVQDIVQRGEWLFPLKRATAIPSKPPLFHWSAALTYQFTGKLDEMTIRFPSALYATLGVLLVYGLGGRLFGAEIGLLGGAILATMQLYHNQALSARVDMTLCFFVSLSLSLFYALYRGFLEHRLWYFALYALVGLGTLAKGPLGILLPGLVIAVFLLTNKRWDLVVKFAFHPGVLVTVILVAGWYGLAITRGGAGFVDRQLLSENFNRFFGGSGHSHPVYYYLPYLFSLSLPWSLFFPFMFWDWFQKGNDGDDSQLFLKLWFGVMLVFFSMSSGKRAVYLLPIYPPLALLLAVWIYREFERGGFRSLLFRTIALLSVVTGVMMLFIALGDVWSHDPGRLFAPIERFLKPKDRANFLVIKDQIASLGWKFDAGSPLCASLWFVFGYFLWRYQVRAAAGALVLLALVLGFLSRGVIEPELSKTKSYRDFMSEVNRRVKPNDKLVVYGEFNSDPVLYYRGSSMDVDTRSIEAVAPKIIAGNGFVIMTEQSWKEMQKFSVHLPAPLVRSSGKGPEGDAPLVLLRAEIS